MVAVTGAHADSLATLTGFYADDEVVRAKELLFYFADSYEARVEGLPRLKVRREGNNRWRLDFEDIMSLAEVLDKRGMVLHQVTVLTAQFAEMKNLLWTARGSQPVQATVASGNQSVETMIKKNLLGGQYELLIR